MDYIKLITSIIICQMAGILGSIFTFPAIDTWYATLVKPELAPPNWIFAPVWTTLFLLMGISLYIIRTKKNNFLALKFFGAQLILNLLWSIIFFGLKNITLAFAEIVLLWIFIVLTISSFRKLSKTASNLLIPYLIWVTFAGYLNYILMVLNI